MLTWGTARTPLLQPWHTRDSATVLCALLSLSPSQLDNARRLRLKTGNAPRMNFQEAGPPLDSDDELDTKQLSVSKSEVARLQQARTEESHGR